MIYWADSPVVSGTLLLLLLLSVLTWSVTLYKLWTLRELNHHNRQLLQDFWQARDWDAAIRVLEQGKGDLARLGRVGLLELRSMAEAQAGLQHLGSPQDVLERALRQQLQNIQRAHERGQAELASIGSTAPFVGLFGTVWGIMHALQDIGRQGAATLDVVAGPIGEALIATAIGIATALPAVLFYNFFLRRLRVHVTELENFAHDFMRLAAKHGYRLPGGADGAQ